MKACVKISAIQFRYICIVNTGIIWRFMFAGQVLDEYPDTGDPKPGTVNR